jgi:hypothetical protein
MKPALLSPKPVVGSTMMLRGVGPVKVTVVGMRFSHITDLDGTHERLTRHRELGVTEPTAPPAPRPKLQGLDAEFLQFS